MSDNPANRNRTRRRVVRQAGPPVEDDRTGIEVREAALGAAGPETTAAEPSTVADAGAAGETAVPKPVQTAKSKPAETAESKPAEASKSTPAEDAESKPAKAADPIDAESADAEPEIVVGSGVADDEPVEDAAESEDGEPDSRLRKIYVSLGRLGSVAAVVALVSALVLIGSGGLFFYHQNRADALRDRRAEYVQVAKQAYLDMVTVKSDTADQDIDRLLSVAGGGLKDEYATNKDEYKKLFEQLKVQSSGKVISAAIERDDKDSATVLLLAQQTVSNVASNGPMQKDYRFRVTVTRKGDSVTASSMELVP
ncbi:hypothetical protein ACQP1O_02765 [Nocardia sp. CA-151230]|uniref:hypothetical protein n=1 Tax=Nocardia sp. CA-151230 TaxID=3239982 RepID=UPI003D8F7209